MRALSKIKTLGFDNFSVTHSSMAATTNCAVIAFSDVHILELFDLFKNPKTFNLLLLCGVMRISSSRNCHALATTGTLQKPLSSPKYSSIKFLDSNEHNSAKAACLTACSIGHCFAFKHLRHLLYRQSNFLSNGAKFSPKTRAPNLLLTPLAPVATAVRFPALVF